MSSAVKTERSLSDAGSSQATANDDGVDEIQGKIIQLCAEYPKGINDAVIQNEIPDLDVKQRATAINNLLLTGKIDIFKQGTSLLYKLKDKSF